MKTLTAMILAAAVAGCGASDPAPAQPVAAPAPATEATPAADADKAAAPAEQAHKHDFPGAVATFHDSLAPLWHAEPGEQRTTDTCNGLATLKDGAAAIQGEAVPEKAQADEAGYKAATDGLVAALGNLEQVCAGDRAQFDESFKAVHEAFHGIVGFLGHEEHESGEHGGEGDHAGEHAH